MKSILFGLLPFFLLTSHVCADERRLDLSTESGLYQAMQAALRHHPSIAGKKAEISVKSYQLKAAESLYYPSVSGEVKRRVDKELDYPQFATFTAKQPLWTFGKVASQIDYAKAEELGEKLDLQIVSQTLLEETALAYAKLQNLYLQQQVIAEHIEQYQSFVDQVNRRQQAGLASVSDVRLATSRLLQAQNKINRIEGEVLVAQDQLLHFTQIETPIDPWGASFFKKLVFDHFTDQVEPFNPQLLYKRQQIQIAEYETEKVRRSLYPTLAIQFEQDLYESKPDHTDLDNQRVRILIEGSLDQLGFSNWHKQQASFERQKVAQQGLMTETNDLRRRFVTLKSQRQMQKDLLNIVNQSVEALVETQASYMRQYKAGRKSWLEVLNMQREVNEQKLQVAKLEGEWLNYSIQLASLSGLFLHLFNISDAELQ